jgi:tight adherence protein B
MFFLFIAFLIFSAALAAAGYYAWSVPKQEEHEILATRLRELRVPGSSRARAASGLLRQERRGRFAPLTDFIAWIGPVRRLQQYIEQANLKYRAPEVLGLSVTIALLSFFAFGFFGMTMLILRLGLAVGLGVIPVFYVVKVRARRLHKFEAALPDAIDLFNRSMRAGHNMHAGLETIAQETFDPVRMEFKKVIEELALGAPLDETLHGLGRRIPLIDLKFFITGLILQRQTGADLVQVLENLAQLVRERLALADKMKAATAQQRFSAGLLCVLPIVVGLGFWILKPDYVALLFNDELGQKALTYAVCSELIGILIIRKIASPRF